MNQADRSAGSPATGKARMYRIVFSLPAVGCFVAVTVARAGQSVRPPPPPNCR